MEDGQNDQIRCELMAWHIFIVHKKHGFEWNLFIVESIKKLTRKAYQGVSIEVSLMCL